MCGSEVMEVELQLMDSTDYYLGALPSEVLYTCSTLSTM